MFSRSSRPLRLALFFNLTLSALCGLALLMEGPAIGAMLGPFPSWLMTALGAGLLGFAALIGATLRHLRVGLGLLISGLDLLWVVSTLPMAVIPGLLTSQGQVVVVAVAAMVGLAGLLQLTGIRAMLRAPDGSAGTYRHCVRLTSGASPGKLWSVIRDLGSISRYASGLKSSRLEGADGPEPGAVRICTNLKEQSWAEELVSIDDDTRSIEIRFRAEADDFPFPFAAMSGGWSVGPAEGGSTVEVWWTVRPRQRHFGWLLLAIATIPIDSEIRRLIAAMEAGGADMSRRTAGLPALTYC